MPSRTFHFKRFSIVKGDIKIQVNLSRFEKQFQDAQYYLDNAVFASMEPFMPMNEGNWLNETRIMSRSMAGTGIIVAAGPPQGRYLYEGYKMVDSATGKGPYMIPNGPGEFVFRYRKGAILRPTTERLKYSTHQHPQVTDHWFDKAKAKDLKTWVKEVKRIAGGGKRG